MSTSAETNTLSDDRPVGFKPQAGIGLPIAVGTFGFSVLSSWPAKVVASSFTAADRVPSNTTVDLPYRVERLPAPGKTLLAEQCRSFRTPPIALPKTCIDRVSSPKVLGSID